MECAFLSRSWKQLKPFFNLSCRCVGSFMNGSMGWRGLPGGQNEMLRSELNRHRNSLHILILLFKREKERKVTRLLAGYTKHLELYEPCVAPPSVWDLVAVGILYLCFSDKEQVYLKEVSNSFETILQIFLLFPDGCKKIITLSVNSEVCCGNCGFYVTRQFLCCKGSFYDF